MFNKSTLNIMYKLFLTVGENAVQITNFFSIKDKNSEMGCHLVQVIQDRLYPFLLAYSWLLALGGSHGRVDQKDTAQDPTCCALLSTKKMNLPQDIGDNRNLRCHELILLSLLENCVILKSVLQGNSF